MNSQFKTIAIFGRVHHHRVITTLNSLIEYLKTLNQHFLIEEITAKALDNRTLPTVARQDISKKCDLLIVVGGDGSLLHAAHTISGQKIPVIGVNRGRLGFLTDILPSQFGKIKNILEGHYIAEKRFLLTAKVTFENQLIGEADALNEVALIPDTIPHMNEFEIYINQQFVCSQDSDGLIIATPTGSTAYALSGGGPILHPELNAIVIVPMFPHTLSHRPIVVPGDQAINIVISQQNTATPRVTCDGQNAIPAPAGSIIKIEKKAQCLNLLHPTDYDYYEALRSKLHWGRKLHYQ